MEYSAEELNEVEVANEDVKTMISVSNSVIEQTMIDNLSPTSKDSAECSNYMKQEKSKKFLLLFMISFD